MSDPFLDHSRWTMMNARFAVDPFIQEEMRKLFRECYGDVVADEMEAMLP